MSVSYVDDTLSYEICKLMGNGAHILDRVVFLGPAPTEHGHSEYIMECARCGKSAVVVDHALAKAGGYAARQLMAEAYDEFKKYDPRSENRPPETV